jgi:hypothetical protein
MSKKYLTYRIVMDVVQLAGILACCYLFIAGGRSLTSYVNTKTALVEANLTATQVQVELLRKELGLAKRK